MVFSACDNSCGRASTWSREEEEREGELEMEMELAVAVAGEGIGGSLAAGRSSERWGRVIKI